MMTPLKGPVLVTGAAGFIGSHVAARLAGEGLEVIGCDNFNAYYLQRLKHDRVAALLAPHGVHCQRVELADTRQVHELFERHRPSAVVHLAAQAGVRHSLKDPASYVQCNLVAFGNVLQASAKYSVQHLLYASSSSVYGANAKVPFDEGDRTDEPLSFYAATKKCNEAMAYSYSHSFGLCVTGLRFFTVYGPWGRPDMAYFSFTERMLHGQTIPVFGRGDLMRDFTYIDDIVEGVARLLSKRTPQGRAKGSHALFNIGNHQPVAVSEFVATLEQVLGVPAKLEYLPMPPGEVPVTFADSSRLASLVGFAPSTSLTSGLQHFADWFRGWNDQVSAKPAWLATERRLAPRPVHASVGNAYAR